MSSPFNGQVFTFTQPDGRGIQLRGWGDQYYAVFETLDGYTVTQNPASGYWEVARLTPDRQALEPAPGPAGPLDARGAGVSPGLRIRHDAAAARGRESALRVAGRRCEQRRQERRQHLRMLRATAAAGGPLLAPPQRETVGDFMGLGLLIDFSDAPGTIARDEVERFCNQQGYAGFGNNGSVRDYFLANSLGRLRYTNIVTPYYRAQRAKSYYTNEQIPQPQRAYELIDEALSHFLGQGFDFTPLTADNQGFVYATNVYYAGPVVNSWAKGLWPHAYHLGAPVALAPGRAAFDYQFTAMGAELTLGTFCHENGHMLCDYPDLYDYGYESSGVGAYCLMCAGGNVSPKDPLPIGAYLKRLSGWANRVTVLTHGGQVALAADSNDFAMHARSGREYFLIENRRRAGRDAALPAEGLAIWHIDEEGDNSHEHMTAASHYECSIEQADGLFQLERLRAQVGDPVDLFAGASARFADDTAPASKWWNGTPSNLTIDQISAPGATMTFRSLLGDVVVPPQTLRRESNPNLAVPDNTTAGVGDTIAVAEARTISAIRVGVDITHTYRGDLRVTLVTPWGAVVELHPRNQGGNAHDLVATYDETLRPAMSTLRGQGTQGTWRLAVQDLAAADVGRLNRWWVEFVTGPAGGSTQPVQLEESPGTAIPDESSAGIARTLTTAQAGVIGAVEVALDISHTYIGDLRVRLRSPAGTEAVLHDRTGGSVHNLARTYTTASAPSLADLAGTPIAGAWTLLVSDLEAADVGKLNRWSLTIRRA